jgi:hypothetical protein
VDVRKVVGQDGKAAYIVDIPGTKVWNAPWQHTNSANDLGTNLAGMAGDDSVLEKGVADAMRRAGVPAGAPVMLVGHSQGGIVAARAATDFVNSGTYNVTNVITAGSPIGRVPIPNSVHVLSLENNNDIVPHLDAAENPDRPNWTTAKFTDQSGTIGGNHDIGGENPQKPQNYTLAARGLDTSTDPSIREFRGSMGAFVGGTSVVTQTYTVSRS